MSNHGDTDDPRGSYTALVRSRPALFANPPHGGIQILIAEHEIRRVEDLVAQRLRTQGLPAAWSRVGVVYEDPYFMVLRDAVRFPDGHESTYVRMLARNGDTAAGVAVLASVDGKLVLLRHFRHATRMVHLEIPRGFMEHGDSTESRVRAELFEELGAIPETLVSLGRVHADSGLLVAGVELFHAPLLRLGAPETSEAIEALIMVDAHELEQRIASGEITDSFTIVAFTRARLRGLI